MILHMIDFENTVELIRRNGNFLVDMVDASYYRIYNVQGGKPLQVRVSTHGTSIDNWYEPSSTINYCIVFSEDGNYESYVTVDMDIRDEEGKIIGKRETFEVVQYIYNCKLLDIDDVVILNKRIQSIGENEGFEDPFVGTEKQATVVILRPNEPIETIVR